MRRKNRSQSKLTQLYMEKKKQEEKERSYEIIVKQLKEERSKGHKSKFRDISETSPGIKNEPG